MFLFELSMFLCHCVLLPWICFSIYLPDQLLFVRTTVNVKLQSLLYLLKQINWLLFKINSVILSVHALCKTLTAIISPQWPLPLYVAKNRIRSSVYSHRLLDKTGRTEKKFSLHCFLIILLIIMDKTICWFTFSNMNIGGNRQKSTVVYWSRRTFASSPSVFSWSCAFSEVHLE